MNISLTGSIEEILLAYEKWKEKKQVNLKNQLEKFYPKTDQQK